MSDKFLTPEEKAADRAIRHNDLYARMLARQQEGLPCWYCNSLWGHYDRCALITGGPEGYTEEQRATLKNLGLSEDDGWQFAPENAGLPSRHATFSFWPVWRTMEMKRLNKIPSAPMKNQQQS